MPESDNWLSEAIFVPEGRRPALGHKNRLAQPVIVHEGIGGFYELYPRTWVVNLVIPE